MDLVPPVLSLDLKPTFIPKTISAFLRDLSMIGNASEKVTKLDDFVKRLEEEMRKIDAFKRELPLCMLLLCDAILVLKDESLHFKTCKAEPKLKPQPRLEEFIPMKESEKEGIKKEIEQKDKKNWMSTFQLYDYPFINTPKHNNESKRNVGENGTATQVETFRVPNHKDKGTGGGRAFMPYSGFPVVRKEERVELPVPGLSLLAPGLKNLKEESGSSGSKMSCGRAVSSSAANIPSSLQTGQRQFLAGRKQRRCWSPELHRRFVKALQELGGSKVATPKQIRELMQVDGLTNDEVKSHLQKYRLHSGKLPRALAARPANQSLVLGGLWMTQNHCGGSSKANSSQSGSPQGPFQTGAPGYAMDDDDDDDEEEDEEEEEEEKSEIYSWKSHIYKSIISDA